jgi:hypothetical protein
MRSQPSFAPPACCEQVLAGRWLVARPSTMRRARREHKVDGEAPEIRPSALADAIERHYRLAIVRRLGARALGSSMLCPAEHVCNTERVPTYKGG